MVKPAISDEPVEAMNLADVLKALSIGENEDWEFKDCRKALGKSWAQTVSAFANSHGGTIIFGIESVDGDRSFLPRGVPDPAAFRQKVWNSLHDRGVISITCCAHGDVVSRMIDGVECVAVHVPAVPRQQRPVHVGKSPWAGNTFMRHESGDYACSDAEVSRMLRDAADAPQDGMIVAGLDLSDIDAATLSAYRNQLRAHNARDKALSLNDQAFLAALGAWKKDGKVEGLTVAGVLMFGTSNAISNACPHLTLSYLERSSANERHDHRISSDDGDWVPNVFNFFFDVYPQIVKGLKKPFALDAKSMREGKTPFHDAIREAAINCIVHADYGGRGTIRIVKRPDAFSFENPGRSLTPIARIREAGASMKSLTDIRNPALARMFARIGYAEKEGYGYPTIFGAWESGKRHEPQIEEDLERNVVSVTLPLMSQISPDIEAAVQKAMGGDFALLVALDKDILLHAVEFGETSAEAVRAIRPHITTTEVSTRLRVLTGKGWLRKIDGSTRSPRYEFTGSSPFARTILDLFEQAGTSPQPPSNLPPTSLQPTSLQPTSHQPTSDEALIEKVRTTRRGYRPDIEKAILALCAGTFRTPRELAEILGRKSQSSFREDYIAPLFFKKKLERLYPESPAHPDQAYRATVSD